MVYALLKEIMRNNVDHFVMRKFSLIRLISLHSGMNKVIIDFKEAIANAQKCNKLYNIP